MVEMGRWKIRKIIYIYIYAQKNKKNIFFWKHKLNKNTRVTKSENAVFEFRCSCCVDLN